MPTKHASILAYNVRICLKVYRAPYPRHRIQNYGRFSGLFSLWSARLPGRHLPVANKKDCRGYRTYSYGYSSGLAPDSLLLTRQRKPPSLHHNSSAKVVIISRAEHFSCSKRKESAALTIRNMEFPTGGNLFLLNCSMSREDWFISEYEVISPSLTKCKKDKKATTPNFAAFCFRNIATFLTVRRRHI